jgi:hypothetical protein
MIERISEGIIFPKDATTKKSGLKSNIDFLTSSQLVSSTKGIFSSKQKSFTGFGFGFNPLPAGLSEEVMTKTSENSLIFLKGKTETSEFPKKTIFIIILFTKKENKTVKRRKEGRKKRKRKKEKKRERKKARRREER